eukprot:1594234-Pyramimonas_sp.AAC.1
MYCASLPNTAVVIQWPQFAAGSRPSVDAKLNYLSEERDVLILIVFKIFRFSRSSAHAPGTNGRAYSVAQ